MRKLCVYGLAGSGKSTVSRALASALEQRGLSSQIVSLARPMYELSDHIYRAAGVPAGKDNQLLRDLAVHLRRINPRFLVDDFLERVDTAGKEGTDVVINDDLRDAHVDYPAMRRADFAFVRVTCAPDIRHHRLAGRGDLNIVDDSDGTWGFAHISPDWTIDNSFDDASDLHTHLTILIDKWLAAS